MTIFAPQSALGIGPSCTVWGYRMAREDCIAFVARIRTDAELARQVAQHGRDRPALVTIAQAAGFDIDMADLDALAAEYERRGDRLFRTG